MQDPAKPGQDPKKPPEPIQDEAIKLGREALKEQLKKDIQEAQKKYAEEAADAKGKSDEDGRLDLARNKYQRRLEAAYDAYYTGLKLLDAAAKKAASAAQAAPVLSGVSGSGGSPF